MTILLSILTSFFNKFKNIIFLVLLISIFILVIFLQNKQIKKLDSKNDNLSELNSFILNKKEIVKLENEKIFVDYLKSSLDSSTREILKNSKIRIERITSYQDVKSNTHVTTTLKFKDSISFKNKEIWTTKVDSPWYKINQTLYLKKDTLGKIDTLESKLDISIPNSQKHFIYLGRRVKRFAKWMFGGIGYGERDIKDTIFNSNPYIKVIESKTIIKDVNSK